MEIHRERLFERLLNRVLGDFVEHQAEKFRPVFLGVQLLLQVKANGFPFTIRVSRQVNVVHALGRGLQLRHQLLLAFDDLIDRLEVVVDVHRQLALRQILYMAYRGLHHKLLAEILTDCFRLRRRFDDDETLFHNDYDLAFWVIRTKHRNLTTPAENPSIYALSAASPGGASFSLQRRLQPTNRARERFLHSPQTLI